MITAATAEYRETYKQLLCCLRAQFFQQRPKRLFTLSPPGLNKDELSRCWHEPELQLDLVEKLFNCKELPLSTEYIESIMNLVVKHLEKLDIQIEDDLIEIYASVLSGPSSRVPWYGPDEEPVELRYFYNDQDYLSVKETPNLLAAHGTTGFRTWSAALALGAHLLTKSDMLKGKRVLELGGGTGFLSLLCAKIGGRQVLCTDGSEEMVDLIRDNAMRSAVDVQTETLLFGTENGIEKKAFDVVLGADITYDDAIVVDLAKTLQRLLTTNPNALVYIAATVRQQRTLDAFGQALTQHKLSWTSSPLAPRQTYFFYEPCELLLFNITPQR